MTARQLGEPIEEPEREVIDAQTYELPEIFVTVDGPNDPTDREIQFVYVFRKNKDGTLTTLEWRPIAELPDAEAIEASWGPGRYILQGRWHDRRTTIRQILIQVGDQRPASDMQVSRAPARGELDIAKLITAATAIVGAVTAPIMTMLEASAARRKEDHDRDMARRDEERRRDEARNETLLSALTGIMQARNSDLEAIIKGQMSAPKQSGGSADAYKEGQMDALQIIEALREGGMNGGDAEVEFLKLAQAFVSGRNAARTDVAGADKTNGSSS